MVGNGNDLISDSEKSEIKDAVDGAKKVAFQVCEIRDFFTEFNLSSNFGFLIILYRGTITPHVILND